MNFEIDILIIYSERDNLESPENPQGWVSNFKRFLEMLLNQVLGEKPNVVLKSEHDVITASNLKQVGIMIPILSAHFIKSGKCLDILEEFFQLLKGTGPQRVFKVVKKPLTSTEQPARLREYLGYGLFFVNPQSGEIEDFIDFFSQDAEHNYWMQLVDLTYDLHESLITLKQTDKKESVKSVYSRQFIYLAETGHDLVIQRNIIKRDLQRHGYKVLPDHTLSPNIEPLKKEIKRDLAKCNLSIHLIGNAYGEIPEGSESSIVDIQHRLASERSSEVNDKPNFSRLIWISPDLEHASEKQLSFIENLKRSMSSAEEVEILQTPLEDFKNIMKEELIEVNINKSITKKSDQGAHGKPSIYVLHDQIDHDEVKIVKDKINKAGYKVLTPSFEGELLDLRQHHISNLRTLDAAIIYQGKVNNQWVRMKLLDLLKAPGFGRVKPIKGKAIISRKKESLDFSTYENQEIILIDEKELDKPLNKFLKDLKDTNEQ